jgi:transcription initiation factor TFIIIB Brf1 subunit/transcription initiation factor TFIIB
MSPWECAIDGDENTFDRVEDLLVHQSTEHERIECKVCGTVMPDGYFAIRHAFDKHTRAEYVRAYDATAQEVRRRENVKESIENEADMREVIDRLEGGDGSI